MIPHYARVSAIKLIENQSRTVFIQTVKRTVIKK